jgi:glutamate formiminotransferase
MIECIPNISEGRDPAVIAAVVAAAESVAEVALLDVSSDADHNRTVITLAGPPEPLVEAAFRVISTAAERISLEGHSGEHPRIGATDVVPFVPLRDASMQACVALAHGLAQRIADELALPVYCYEDAALRPAYRNLADVRRYPYEQLKAAITADHPPDFGPASLGPAGAVAVGARGPLIAFNAYLDTDDVEIAQAIARTVRESGGGLPHLKALGFFVDGRAQVSMNVIDFRRTSLHTILAAVRTEAARHGVRVTHTEIVGLVPQTALIDSALAALGLPEATRTLILEQRLGTMTGDFRPVAFE